MYAVVKDGELFYDVEKAEQKKRSLENGKYLFTIEKLEPLSAPKEYRACYFAKIDILKDELGDDRYSVHSLIKEHVLEPMMQELPELFESEEISTKSLLLEGWKPFIQRLDIWAFTEHNVIL